MTNYTHYQYNKCVYSYVNIFMKDENFKRLTKECE